MKSNIVRCGLCLASFLFCLSYLSPALVAETPGNHPAYVHALSNLHDAHVWLDKPEGSPRNVAKQLKALGEIEAAISEIIAASIHDGKKPADFEHFDPRLPRTQRLNRALAHLDQAYQEIREKEDNQFAKGLQKRALRHIERARDAIRQIL